jgi:chaperonin GroES
MKVKPLGDRIVVRRFDPEEKTAGGIVLPDTAKNKPQQMLKDGSRRGLQIKVGDTVLFTPWAGDEYKAARGEEILLMREEDILAVIDE